MLAKAYLQHARTTCWPRKASFNSRVLRELCAQNYLKALCTCVVYLRCVSLFKGVRQKVEKEEDIVVLADVTLKTRVERGQWSLLLSHQCVMFSPLLTSLLFISYLPQLKLCASVCLS